MVLDGTPSLRANLTVGVHMQLSIICKLKQDLRLPAECAVVNYCNEFRCEMMLLR